MGNARSNCSRLLVPALAVSLALGCGEAPVTTPVGAPPASASRGQPEKELPFSLSADAVILDLEFAPGFGPPLFGTSDFGGHCSVPADVIPRFSLEGQATYLGRFTGIGEHCTRINWAMGGSFISDGVLTLTAANGDELWSNYERVTSDPDTPEVHTFVGGTGRFASASGGGLGDPECVIDIAAETGTCTFTLEGVIVYDASIRSR